MPNLGILTVKLVAEATKFEETMRRATRSMETTAAAMTKTAERMQSLGRTLMVGVTIPLGLAGGAALKMAMDVIESENLFEVAMGSMAHQARAFSTRLRDELGLNQYEVRRNVGTLYQMVSAMGISENAAYQMSTGLTELSYDMASFFNLRPDEAFAKIRSGLVGETEPLRQLGVLVDETRVRQLLLTRGIVRQGEEITQQHKVLGRYLAILEQTANAQGDLARTLDSPVNQLRVLRAELEQAGIALGQALLPALQAVLPHARRMADLAMRLAVAFGSLPPVLRDTVIWLAVLAATSGPALWVFGGVARVAGILVGATGALAGAAGRAAFAFAAWKGGAARLSEALTFLAGGRIRLVIITLGALVAVTLLVVRHWERLAAVGVAVWHSIGAAALFGASLVVRGVGLILCGVSAIVPALWSAAMSVLGLADALRASAVQSWSAARGALGVAGAVQQAARGQSGVARAGQQAADSQDRMAESMEAAAKAAASNIQSFDQVHQVQEAMSSTVPEMPVLDFPMLPGVGGPGADIGAALGEEMSRVADLAAAAWERLRQAMEPVNRAVQWIRDNWPTIGPIAEGIASVIMATLVPALIKSGIEGVIAGGKLVAAWVMQGAAAAFHGAKVVLQLGLIGARWAWAGLQALIHAGKVVAAWAMQGIAAALQGARIVAQLGLVAVRWAWVGAQALIHAGKVALAWFIAMGPIAWAIAAVIALVALIIWKWDEVKRFTIAAWSAVSDWLSRSWERIRRGAAVLAQRLANIWEGIKQSGLDAWRGLVSGIIVVINLIISALNVFIRAINRIYFDVPDWVPVIGGMRWGFHLPLLSRIPMLAEGGIVTAPTLAMVGERGPEAVVPLGRSELADQLAQAVYTAIRDAIRMESSRSRAGQGGSQEIVLKVNDRALARALLPATISEAQRSGLPGVIRPEGVWPTWC